VGDLGRINGNLENGGRERVISVRPFFEESIYQAGTFSRLAELYAFLEGGGGEGDDTMLGGEGHDRLHGGPGDDIMNGNGDQDRLFGGDGQDVVWGGPDHDHLWGGYQDDYLDVRPRPADPADWFTYGEPDNYQGLDLIYGGWHRDALQADVAAPGPREADRLIDWAGGYNVFYVCPGAYGEGTITRRGSPHLQRFLQDLAEADGALSTATEGSSGFRELGYVFPNERGQNSHPPHPDHPGHFTCGAVEPGPPTLRTTAIELSYTAKKRHVTVAGEVTVQDQDAAAVKGARLTIQWTVPGGAEPITQRARTDKQGIASFSVKDAPGVYTLTIVDVVLDGYTFDTDHSVLSASIDTTE
jgi:hypothetical protein